ncbi:unnamed protein product [Paramecium primaurelia]|uniref:Uncharacterized protein n=1 Tax=Paramecium primaurelia TaxID=5886 RepID=A0A8S1KTI0_PARPR|nr:unnamed protein product [Paramecium primaurelia]
MDITQKFMNISKAKINIKNEIEKPIDVFNKSSQYIHNMTTTILQFMNIQKDKYTAITHLSGHPFSEKERNEFDIQVSTQITNCSQKIKELQQMQSNSKTKTEYVHKEVIISFLIAKLNQIILLFREFKYYRQKQKQQISQYPKKKINIKIDKKYMIEFKTQNMLHLSNSKQSDHSQIQNLQIQKQYQDDINEIISIKEQISDICLFIQNMQNLIVYQEMQTEQILLNATDSFKHIEAANNHLFSSVILNEQLGSQIGSFFFFMGIILLIYDFIHA